MRVTVVLQCAALALMAGGNDSTEALAAGPSTSDNGVHWSFVPPESAPTPVVEDFRWPRTMIDRFIARRREERGLAPVADADRLTLLRRLQLDLTGLPPTPDEVIAIHQNDSPTAVTDLVDRLLASPQFGAHWGRYWLDIVRYADSVGLTHNRLFPLAWKYRNYVIESLTRDKPYDLFLREQIAGDLLPSSEISDPRQARVATGFYAIGCRNFNEKDSVRFRAEEVAEQIDAFGRSMLGLTLGCARCHDHKTAPVPLDDYYALAGVFYSSEPLTGYGRFSPGIRVRRRFDLLVSQAADETWQRDARMARDLFRVIDAQMVELANMRRKIEDADPFDEARHKELSARIKEKRELFNKANRQLLATHNLAMGVGESGDCRDICIQTGGDPRQADEVVPRAFLPQLASHVSAQFADAAHVAIPPGESGRRQLAEWVTRPDHPLVARVIVNRIWGQLFGRGLVRTVDNLGPSGDLPSHPELLDQLAIEFVDSGWSLKQLIRRIVLSRVYQQSTDSHANNLVVDPDNVLLWRMNPRRLDAEAIRDSMLLVSGKLEARPPSSALFTPDPMSVSEVENEVEKHLHTSYRSVYLPVFRSALPGMFQALDFRPPEQVCGRRDVTTVPTQALFFLNNPLVSEFARAAAERLLAGIEAGRPPAEQVYLETVARPPTAAERVDTMKYVADARANGQSEVSAWSDIYHAQFASVEFLFRN